MTLNQTVYQLNRLVKWGYDRRRINGKLLEGFQDAIKSLAAMEEPGGSEATAEDFNRLTGELIRLRQASAIAGFTPKAVARLHQMDDDFLDWFAVHGFTIGSEIEFIAFLAVSRWYNTLCETDLRNIAYYGKLLSITDSGNIDKMRPYLAFMRDMCPHLSRYFDQVESGQEIDEMEANNQLYKHHLWNSTR